MSGIIMKQMAPEMVSDHEVVYLRPRTAQLTANAATIFAGISTKPMREVLTKTLPTRMAALRDIE